MQGVKYTVAVGRRFQRKNTEGDQSRQEGAQQNQRQDGEYGQVAYGSEPAVPRGPA